jgi:hypothetical protein
MANKKINQLVAKTTILPTDLFPLGNPTTGQLFKKTVAELQAAIGGAVISVNGLVGTVVLDTDDIAELATPTNRFFTEARARAAISLTTTGNSGASTYSNSTGVLNVPTYTLAGLGGITASFLSGGTGITYNSSTGVIAYSGTVYTDASIRALFSAGTGITYNSSTGAITNTAPDQTVSISAGTGMSVSGTYPSFTIAYTGTVYTDSSIRGLFSLTTTGTSGAASYNASTGVINVPNYTLAGLGGISLTALSGTAPITYNSSTGVIGITQASTSTNGFLSSTDWNTFNGKQSALTLGNVSEVVSNVLMFPDGGTNKTIGNLTIQVVQAGSTTSGFLSTTDWNTFNNKQGTITLTTTGTSGAATLSSGTLNIPQYQAVLTNPVTGTGTTNYVIKWTSSSAIGNSQIFDNGTAVGIGTNSTGFNTAGLPLIVGSGTGNTGMTIFSGATSFGSIHFADAVTTGNASFSGFVNYDHTNNSMQFGTTNTERIRISSSGNLGIGNTAPINQLDLNRSGAPTLFDAGLNAVQNGGEIEMRYIAAGQAGGRTGAHIFYTGTAAGGTERMRLTSGGALLINRSLTTNDSVYKLVVRTSTNVNIGFGLQEGQASIESFNDAVNVSNPLRIYGAPLALVGGNTLVGTLTDNGEKLYVAGSIRATGSITANSDVRLKKNIERIENALEKVGQISGYTYNTIYDEDRHAGVIAQEIDKVLPEIVNAGNDGLMGVEYGNISALLIEAIKDLKKDNESLRAIVEGLTK